MSIHRHLAIVLAFVLAAACGETKTRPTLSADDQALLAASIGAAPVAGPQPPLLAPAGLAGPTAMLAGSADDDLSAAAEVATPVGEQLQGKLYQVVRTPASFAASPEAIALAADPSVARTVALVKQAAARQVGITPTRRVNALRRVHKVVTLAAFADARAGRGRDAAYALVAVAWLARGPLAGAPFSEAMMGGVVTRLHALESLAELVEAGQVSRADLQAMEPALSQVLDMPHDYMAILRATTREERLMLLATFGQGIAATTARATLDLDDVEVAETRLCGQTGCGSKMPSARGALAEAAAIEIVTADPSPRGRAHALLTCWLAPGIEWDSRCLAIAHAGDDHRARLAKREGELRQRLAAAR